MEWVHLIKLLKDHEDLIPLLVFAFLILGPIIKTLVQKKKQQGRPAPRSEAQEEEDEDSEESEEPGWWGEPEPAKPIPAAPPKRVEPPAHVAARREPEIPIERASEDVEAEAASVANEADAVSDLSRQREFTPSTQPAKESLLEPAAAGSSRSGLDRLNSVEAALVLGSVLDRPVAFGEPSWDRF